MDTQYNFEGMKYLCGLMSSVLLGNGDDLNGTRVL
jgi:hypothetical protein